MAFAKKKTRYSRNNQPYPPKDFLSTITALKESIQKREDLEEESKRSFHTQIEPLCSWAEKDGLQAQFSMFKLGGKQAKIPVI